MAYLLMKRGWQRNEADLVVAWQKTSVAQRRLVDFPDGRKDYRVVASNGTDISMSVAGTKWITATVRRISPM
jgi:leucyl aminopeptidase (aminopeptidase T)